MLILNIDTPMLRMCCLILTVIRVNTNLVKERMVITSPPIIKEITRPQEVPLRVPPYSRRSSTALTNSASTLARTPLDL